MNALRLFHHLTDTTAFEAMGKVMTLDGAIITAIFGDELPLPSHWEAVYPSRALPPGALVTRFAPSPTGFLHIGGLYTAMISRDLATASSGVCFVRIEDTDKAREVEGARQQFRRAFDYFSIHADESDTHGRYGPYEQSQRAPIYRTYARELLRNGRAYPCFCTHDELAALSARQQAAKATPGYGGEWARCRHLTANEVLDRLRLGIPYTLRFRSPGAPGQRVAFVDAIRGELSHIQNMNDVVLLKSPASSPASLPTYHFAHVVDDHLMRVTHVIRGEEWISSVPLHLQLFHAIGTSPVTYAHVAPLMKLEGSSRRKLSKRKDPEASVDYYIEAGYPAGAVRHYLRGLANSRLAEMSFAATSAEPLRLDEFSSAGPLFDLVKLESVSQDYISEMTIEEVEAAVTDWSRLYDPALAQVLDQHHALVHRMLSLERSFGDNPRKDLTKWSDFRRVYGLFFPGVFADVLDPHDPRFAPVDASTVRTLAADFARLYSDRDDDKETWFRQIRELATAHGFAATAGEFKRTPAKYAGSIRDASNVIRVALTGSTESMELFFVAKILGPAEVRRRAQCLSSTGQPAAS